MAFIQNVARLGQIVTAQGLIEEFPYNCQIAPIFPFMGLDGYGLQYATREQIDITYEPASTRPAEILSESATSIQNHTDGATGSSPMYALGELATRYQIPYSQEDRYEFPNPLVQTLRRLAERRLVYRYFSFLGGTTGGGDGDFPRLRDICDPGFVVNCASNPMLLRLIDQAYHNISEGPGRPNAIMSHSRARRTWLQALYDLGMSPEYVNVEMQDPLRGSVSVKIPACHGTPWYVNDLIEIENAGDPEAERTRVFFMLLGDSQTPGGGRGVTGIIPKERVGDMFVHRQTSFVNSTPEVDVDCTWPVGLAMASKGALSILEDFLLTPNGV